MTPNHSRSLFVVAQARQTVEGDGMMVHRVFPTPSITYLDPFLLLDEMGPITLPPQAQHGFPDHPHRGFETVTYLLSGAMEHHDSTGNKGTLTPGDVQWMTAGSGVVHSEMPERTFAQTGGTLHGFQLWVNLPAKDKMIPPHYQEIPSKNIPTATTPDGLGTVRVIAGEFLSQKAVIATRTPITYLHISLQPGGTVTHTLAQTHTAFAYVINGQARFGTDENHVTAQHIAVFASDSDHIHISCDAAATEPAELLLIAGEPLNELVARYGPFVMNTEAEIYQAIEDYRTGRMGRISSPHP